MFAQVLWGWPPAGWCAVRLLLQAGTPRAEISTMRHMCQASTRVKLLMQHNAAASAAMREFCLREFCVFNASKPQTITSCTVCFVRFSHLGVTDCYSDVFVLPELGFQVAYGWRGCAQVLSDVEWLLCAAHPEATGVAVAGLILNVHSCSFGAQAVALSYHTSNIRAASAGGTWAQGWRHHLQPLFAGELGAAWVGEG